MKIFITALSLLLLPLSTIAATKTIVALGDSLTEGYGIAMEKAYPAILEQKLKTAKKDVKVINAGSSGSTSASAESRLLWQLKSKPDILILALGANDGLRGLPPKSTYENLAKAIELAQKNKLKVILTGMMMPQNYGDDYRKQYAATFTDLAQKYKVTLMPFLLEGVAMKKELNLADGIHPNEKGHEVIAERMLPIVQKEL
ncbi:MAG: arylesterase [Bdellovibrionales bacterium]|nr:arylesterase [Bdellovibrionales bacterium]